MSVPSALPAVHQSAMAILPKSVLFVCTMEILQKIRHTWKWVHEVSRFFNFDEDYRPTGINFDYSKRIAVGGVAYVLAKDSIISKKFAQVIFLAYNYTCFRDAKVNAVLANKSWIKYAIKGDYYTSINVERAPWLEKIFGPTKAFWMQYNISSLTIRIQKIAVETFAMLAMSFYVVMAAGDLYDACVYCIQLDGGNEALIKIADSVYKIMEEIAQSKDAFINWIDANEKMLATGISLMRLPFNTKQFRNFASTSLENTIGAYNISKKVIKAVDGKVWNFLQDGLFTIWMCGPGFVYTPDWMIPGKEALYSHRVKSLNAK